ncbi:MAG: hypothetical protein ACOYEV_01665 [Candidatus Nanopelagicales bacterium]
MAALSAPDAHTRWRCAQCGNLTRFDVVRSARTSEYWHFDLSGEMHVESAATLGESIESVTCLWCGNGHAVELVARPGLALTQAEAPAEN